jgi:Glycosyltransferase 61
MRELGVEFLRLGSTTPPTRRSRVEHADDPASAALAASFDHDYPADTTGAFGLLKLPRTRLHMPSAVHTVSGWLLRESLPSTNLITNPKYWALIRMAPLRRARRLAPGVLGALAWGHNFYHWLIETMPRLQMLESCDPALPIYLPQSSPPFVAASIRMLGLQDRVSWLANGVYEAESLIVPTRFAEAVYPTAVAVDWLRARLRQAPPPGERGRLLYVSRRDANIRFVTNEDEVADAMLRLGFETVSLSGLDLDSQVRLMSSARCIVGAHGAGLSHLAFVADGGMVVEFFEEGHSSPSFYYLASLRTAGYACLVCPREGLGYRVDVPQLERLVRRMLAQAVRVESESK